MLFKSLFHRSTALRMSSVMAPMTLPPRVGLARISDLMIAGSPRSALDLFGKQSKPPGLDDRPLRLQACLCRFALQSRKTLNIICELMADETLFFSPSNAPSQPPPRSYHPNTGSQQPGLRMSPSACPSPLSSGSSCSPFGYLQQEQKCPPQASVF